MSWKWHSWLTMPPSRMDEDPLMEPNCIQNLLGGDESFPRCKGKLELKCEICPSRKPLLLNCVPQCKGWGNLLGSKEHQEHGWVLNTTTNGSPKVHRVCETVAESWPVPVSTGQLALAVDQSVRQTKCQLRARLSERCRAVRWAPFLWKG